MEELRRHWIDSGALEGASPGFAREVETVLKEAKGESGKPLFDKVCTDTIDQNWIGITLRRTIRGISKEVSIRVTGSQRWVVKSKATNPNTRIFCLSISFNRRKFTNSVSRLF